MEDACDGRGSEANVSRGPYQRSTTASDWSEFTATARRMNSPGIIRNYSYCCQREPLRCLSFLTGLSFSEAVCGIGSRWTVKRTRRREAIPNLKDDPCCGTCFGQVIRSLAEEYNFQLCAPNPTTGLRTQLGCSVQRTRWQKKPDSLGHKVSSKP